jgi:DNA-binding response OmpR family regulator
VARIGAVLRRASGRRDQGVLQTGELRIDPVSREVTLDERAIELSAKEFALLRTLAAEPTRVFTKEELLRDVWGFKLMGTSRRSPMSCRVHARLSHKPLPSAPGRTIQEWDKTS